MINSTNLKSFKNAPPRDFSDDPVVESEALSAALTNNAAMYVFMPRVNAGLVAAQIASCMRYAVSNGLNITGCYIESYAPVAGKRERLRMMADAKRGRFDIVISDTDAYCPSGLEFLRRLLTKISIHDVTLGKMDLRTLLRQWIASNQRHN